MSNNKKGLRTWVEIDREAIKHNYRIFRSIIKKDCLFMAVVKSNAYGHGLVEFAKELSVLRVDWFGVDELDEAISLRQAGIKKPILVFGFTSKEKISIAADLGISLTISNEVTLNALRKYKGRTPIKIHIKADTGLHRQGFLTKDLSKTVAFIKKIALNQKVKIEGLYTHFSAAESPDSPYSKKQLKEFAKWVEVFEDMGLRPIYHTAGTAAAMLMPESHFDMVRIGIGLYGLWPSSEVKKHIGNKIQLNPVLSWKTVVGDVKNLKAGDIIGYDLTERVKKNSKIAVCPIGYWHGFPRALSSRGVVAIFGKTAKILGRVSMDMIVIDVTDISGVKTGDEVTIIGKSGEVYRSAEEVARASETINYEIVTRINPLIKRVYL